MFLPAEAIFAEIHAHFPELVDESQRARVWLVSPTTLMAVLTTARAVLKDEATRKQLDRGQRVTELMKQKQYSPLSVGQMAVSLFAADRGYLDDVELNKIGAFETALLDHVGSAQAELLETLNGGDWNEDLEARLTAVLEDFKATGSW